MEEQRKGTAVVVCGRKVEALIGATNDRIPQTWRATENRFAGAEARWSNERGFARVSALKKARSFTKKRKKCSFQKTYWKKELKRDQNYETEQISLINFYFKKIIYTLLGHFL